MEIVSSDGFISMIRATGGPSTAGTGAIKAIPDS